MAHLSDANEYISRIKKFLKKNAKDPMQGVIEARAESSRVTAKQKEIVSRTLKTLNIPQEFQKHMWQHMRVAGFDIAVYRKGPYTISSHTKKVSPKPQAPPDATVRAAEVAEAAEEDSYITALIEAVGRCPSKIFIVVEEASGRKTAITNIDYT